MSRLICFMIAGIIALASATPVRAFDLNWQMRDASDEVESAIYASSLLDALKRQGGGDAQDILGAAQADYGRFVATLYDQGFYAPVVTIQLDGREAAAFPPIAPPPDVQKVVVSVQTGPRFSFGQAIIEPRAYKSDPLGDFVTGETAKLTTIRETTQTQIDGWRNQGHAKATVGAQSITARHQDAALDVVIGLDPGPKLKFGDLGITGESAVRTDRIRDIAGLPTGQPFSPSELERVAARLRRTGTFDVVTLTEADRANDDDSIDVELQVADRLPRRFGFGAEISSQEGASVSAFWLHRNLFGGAERLRIDGEISGMGGQSGGEDYLASARYSRPATFNEDTDFFALVEFESLNEPSFTSRKSSVQLGAKRYATERREYTLGLGIENARTTDALGAQDYTIVTLPLGVQFDYRDDKLDPKDGYFALVELTPFIGVEGTSDGALFKFDGRAYYSVPSQPALTFALRSQIGAVVGPDAADAPADFLFFSGGGGTVRGQEYQSLGVDIGGGEQIGGRAFVGLSAEARYQVTDTYGLVGFFDTGFIGSDGLADSATGEWHSGAGIGLRYNTGIGPIRLDLAVPIDGPENASSLQVYVGIGQSF